MVRSPKQLRLHRALEELGWTGVINEFNKAARLKDQSVPVPVLGTTNGTILAGFGRWRSALFDVRHEINCIEYSLSEEEALQFIISHYQPQSRWNKYVRIWLALKTGALLPAEGMRQHARGGKYKGWANLPEAQRIDVRQSIAGISGVGARTVSNVKTNHDVPHSSLGEGTCSLWHSESSTTDRRSNAQRRDTHAKGCLF